MQPDIFTNMFSDKNMWRKARHLISMVSPSELKEVVPVHVDIHSGILEKTTMPAVDLVLFGSEYPVDDTAIAAASPGGGSHTPLLNMITDSSFPRSKHAVDPKPAKLNTKVKLGKRSH